ATSTETMLSVTATIGGGDSVGIAGTASIAIIDDDTEVYLGDHASLLASGTVMIIASDALTTTMIAGSVGAAGTAGIGASNTTLVYTPTTLAYVGDYDTVTAGAAGLSVEAQQSEDLLTITAGIAVGGSVGVAGSATVNVITDTTTAHIGHDTTVTVTGTGADLTVSANDDTSVISVAGDLAAGGDVGVGVGADVGVFDKHTNAFIASGVT